MSDRMESVITHLQIIHTWAAFARERDLQFFTAKHLEDITKWTDDALELLKEQKELKERFIEAFNTIRDAYNVPTNREKILLNYLARNACCCERKILIDSDALSKLEEV